MLIKKIKKYSNKNGKTKVLIKIKYIYYFDFKFVFGPLWNLELCHYTIFLHYFFTLDHINMLTHKKILSKVYIIKDFFYCFYAVKFIVKFIFVWFKIFGKSVVYLFEATTLPIDLKQQLKKYTNIKNTRSTSDNIF